MVIASSVVRLSKTLDEQKIARNLNKSLEPSECFAVSSGLPLSDDPVSPSASEEILSITMILAPLTMIKRCQIICIVTLLLPLIATFPSIVIAPSVMIFHLPLA